MTIVRTDSEIIIKIPGNVNIEGVQRLLDYLIYQEATAKSQAKQKVIDELASEFNKSWWKKNKDRFLKQ